MEPESCLLRGFIDAVVLVGMKSYLTNDDPVSTPYEVLSLRREYFNSKESNAIAVTYPKLKNRKIGYLPRHFTVLLAPMFDAGAAYARVMVPFTPEICSKPLTAIPCQILLFTYSGSPFTIRLQLCDTSEPDFVLYPRITNINIKDFDDMVARETGIQLSRPFRKVPVPVQVQVPVPESVPVRSREEELFTMMENESVPVRSREEELFTMMENEPLVMNSDTNNVQSARFTNIMDAIDFLSGPLDPNLAQLSLMEIAATKGITFPEPDWYWYPSGQGSFESAPIERTNGIVPSGGLGVVSGNEDQP